MFFVLVFLYFIIFQFFTVLHLVYFTVCYHLMHVFQVLGVIVGLGDDH